MLRVKLRTMRSLVKEMRKCKENSTAYCKLYDEYKRLCDEALFENLSGLSNHDMLYARLYYQEGLSSVQAYFHAMKDIEHTYVTEYSIRNKVEREIDRHKNI